MSSDKKKVDKKGSVKGKKDTKVKNLKPPKSDAGDQRTVSPRFKKETPVHCPTYQTGNS